MDYVAGWAEYLVPLVIVIVAFGWGMRRQAGYFKTQSENSLAQAAELRKIGQSLDRIAAALEKQK